MHRVERLREPGADAVPLLEQCGDDFLLHLAVQAERGLALGLVEAQLDERVLVGQLAEGGEECGALGRVLGLDQGLERGGREPVSPASGRAPEDVADTSAGVRGGRRSDRPWPPGAR